MPRGLSARTTSNALIGATLVSAFAAAAGAAAAGAPTRLAVALGTVLAIVTAGLIFFARPGLRRPRAGVVLTDAGSLGKVIFALVVASVFLVTYTAVRPLPGATASDLVLLGAALVIGVCLADSSWKIRQIVPGWLLGAAVLLLSAALLVALFPPGKPSQAALLFPGEILAYGGVDPAEPTLSNGGAAVRFVGTLIFIPLLIAVAANSARRIQILADAWIAGVAIGALFGILGYLGIGGVVQLVGGVGGVPWEGGVRVSGLTTHSNAFALASAMALPVAAMRLGRTRGRVRIYFSAVVSVLIGAIVISGSRGGLIGGVLGLAFVAVLDRDGRTGFKRTAVFTAAVAVVVAVAVAPPSPPSLTRLLGSGQASAVATQQREAIYPAVWGEVMQRPVVGHGFQYIRGSHNIYLQLLHGGGVIALAGFVLFGVAAGLTGFRLGRSEAVPDDLQSLSRASVASMAVWLIAVGMVNPAIFDRYLYVPVGLVVAIRALERRARSSQSTVLTPAWLAPADAKSPA
jgi:O-antigen ligase